MDARILPTNMVAAFRITLISIPFNIHIMKIRSGFNIRKVCGENIIVPQGKENLDFGNIISMNDSSALLWSELQGKDFSVKDMADILMANFEIDDNTPLPLNQAIADATSLAKKWKECGLVED